MAILNHGSTIRTADGGQSTTTIVTASNIGTYGVAANSTYFIGTTQNVFNRASGAQTLTGVNIDGNSGGIYAAGGASIKSSTTGTAYTSHIQIREADGGGSNTSEIYAPALGFHWAGVVASNILMESSGRIAIRNNPGSGYENFIAAIIYAGSSVQAPIFYDSNNTSYYLDPANSGTSLLVAGSIGAGLTTPLHKIQASGLISASDATYNNDSTFIGAILNNDGTNPGLDLRRWNGGAAGTNNHGTTYIATNSAGDTIFYNGLIAANTRATNEKMRIAVNGNVGIGTTSPSQKLHVVGTGFASADFRAPIFYDSDNTTYYLDPNASTSGNLLGVLKQNDGKFVRDSYFRTISGVGDYYASGASGWYTVASITLTTNCTGGVLYGTLYDNRYDGADAYQIAIVARAECDFTTNNESHYVNVGCTILGSTNIINYQSKIRVLLVASSTNSRTYEVQFLETAWNRDTWQLETGGSPVWTIYSTAQAPGTSTGTARVFYISNKNADNIRANTASYSPIYYDSSDTSYYSDPAGLNRFNALNIGNQGALTGNTTYALGAYHNSRYMVGLRYSSGGAAYPWLVHDSWNGSAFIIHFNGVGDRFHVSESGIAYVTGDFRAPIFYDSNNTSYYLDPASTSNLNALVVAASGRVGGAASRSTSGLTVGFTDNSTFAANTDVGDTDRMLSIVNESSTTNAMSVLGFRVNPNGGTANAMLDVKFVQTGATNTSALHYTFNHGGTFADRFSILSSGNVGIGTTSPTQLLDVRGNIKLGGDNSGNYVYYVTDIERTIVRTTRSDVTQEGLLRSDGWGNFTFSNNIGVGLSLGTGYGVGSVGSGIVYANGSVRAPIFYDSNNTSYYLDPASTSNLVGLTVANTITGSISGNAATATTSLRSTIEDTRAAQRTPNDYDDYRASYEFTNAITGLGDWHSAFTLQGWHNGYAAWQIIGPASTSAHENFYLRSGVNTTWNSVRTILHSGNYNSYSPTLTGTGASGSWGINITGSSASSTGNAATATTLQTARTINGTSFNGSANITTSSWGTARTLTIGSTGKSVDGSAAVSWSLAEIGALPLSGGQITGNTTFSADNHLTFGPNSTWGSSIRIGGNGYTATGTETASVVTTDGNLHLDAAKSTNGIYLNWYGGTSGVFFGNGSSGQVAFVSNTGNASFSGVVDATQFRDASNTAFYLDPASTSRLNIVHSNYYIGEITDSGNGDSNAPFRFESDYSGWSMIFAGTPGSTNGWGTFWAGNDNPAYYYFGASNPNEYVFVGAGSLKASIDLDNGQSYFATSLRSPIFYDSDNTSYYLDPSSASNLNNVTVAGTLTLSNIAKNSTAPIVINSGQSASLGLRVYYDMNLYNTLVFTDSAWNGQGSIFGSSGVVTINAATATTSFVKYAGYSQEGGSFRAPIFYDSNDTTYYVDAASTSQLNQVASYYLRNLAAVSTDHQFGLYFNNSIDTAYAIYREGGAWTNPYPDLRIAFHTGIKIGANAGYNGVRFYDDYGMANQVMSVNNSGDGLGANNVYVNNSLQAGSSLRAPIFYDSNNTAYYIDPANISNLNTITAAGNITAAQYYTGGWFRNSGSGNGLYNESTGQHFYSDNVSYWNVASSSGGQGIRLRTGGYNGTIRGYFYGNDSNDVGLLNQDGNWRVRVVGGDYLLADGSSIRGQIFYDSNDTNYYVNPASNSVLNGLYANSYNNLVNDFKDVYVYGDVNTYYVVLIQGEYTYSYGRYSVTRGYNWTGPDTWNTASHKGGLTLDWEWSGDTAWGGNDKAIRIIEFNESYSNMVAGLGYPVNGGVIIWLRGGGVNGAQYRIRTPIGSNSTVTVYDGVTATNHSSSTSFTAADSTVFSTRANTNNVSAEISARYPVRGAASLYNENNAVLDQGSTSQTKSGILSSSASLRAPIFYDTDNTAYFIDGAGTSNLLGLTVTNTITGSVSGNAVTAGGLAVHSARNNEANKIVRTDSNGYIQAGWINTTSGDNGTTAIDRIYASSDAYIRYYTPANFRTVLDVPTRGGSGASGTWGINISGNAASATSATSATTATEIVLTGLNNGTVSINNPRTAVYRNENGLGAALAYAPVLHAGGGDTMWQIQGTYGSTGNGTFYFRQGYQGVFGNWLTMLSSANYNSYSPTLTGTGASGSWGISVTGSSASCTGNSATTTLATKATRANGNFYIDDNYGNTVVGLYSANRYQGVFAMGDSYKLAADGTTTGTLYGIAWSHPNAGGVAANLNTHGALILENGAFLAALSGSIRSRDDMRSPIFYDSNDTAYLGDFASRRATSINGFTARTKMTLGLTAKYQEDRADHTGDTNYWVGAMGWINVDMNTLFDYGCGFIDTWNNPGNQPSGTSHWTGIQSMHYTNGTARYGWQMVGGPIQNLRFRNTWSTFTSWKTIPVLDVNDGNSGGMYAGAYYDSSDTAYYLDPASTSVLNRINLNTAATAYMQWRSAGQGTISGGFPFYHNASYGSINIEVSDNDTGGLVIDNEGVTVYGAGDNGQVFRVIDEDVYQATSNITASTTFYVNQLQNGGGGILGPFSISGTATAASFSGAGTGLTGTAASLSIGGNAANVTGTVAIANGGTGATTNANARTNLGATTVGSNLFTLTNPSAITFLRVNADNTVSALNASDFRNAIGAGGGGVTVETSVTQSLSGTTGCTIDVAAANVHILSLANATTISSFTYNNRNNNPSVNTLMIVLKYAGNASITWTNVIWSNNINPTLTQASGYADVFMLTSYKGGAGTPVWIGTVVAAGLVSTNL